MARPTKYTPERAQRIFEALRAGSTRKNACAYAGIEQHTFQRWLLRFAHFAQDIEKAESDVQTRYEALIAQAAQGGTWQAAAWWLERRRSADYGQRARLDLTVRQQAERIAAELGVEPAALLAEAERIINLVH